MMNENYEFDEDYNLLEIITSNINNVNQFLIFYGSNNELYAINVSKIVEVLVYKDLEMVHNGKNDKLIKGSAKIRNSMATIINFDEWFGNKVLPEKEYEYVILTAYGGHELGIMVRSVEYIMSINLNSMQNNSMSNSKSNFVASIVLHQQKRLCTIFDGDQLLIDIFKDFSPEDNINLKEVQDNKFKNKYVLFADDSKFVRTKVKELLEQLSLEFMIFENGALLFEAMQEINKDEIGLIITDLEMPVMDGQTLIGEIKKSKKYFGIPIIIHSNMSHFILKQSLLDSGVKDVIGKIDMKRLSKSIIKYFN